MEIPGADELLERLSALPAAAPLLPRLAEEPGVHLVAGAVRDLLLGGKPGDLDLVVEGDAVAVARSLGGELRIHDRFGTCTVTLEGFSYDFAAARRERYPEPGALPEVEPAPLSEDLQRRDFTVNALAIELGGSHRGRLSSAPNGPEDLQARRLRVMHDASFVDDPTRLLRMVRYETRLSFDIEPHTKELARIAVSSGVLSTLSGPRLGTQLRLLAREPDPVKALAGLGPWALDTAIHPRFGLEDEDLGHRALDLLGTAGRRDLLALSLAARGVPGGQLRALLNRLAFEAGDREVVLSSATRADDVAPALRGAERPSEIARAVAGASPELVAIAGALGAADAAGEWLERIRHVHLEIDGDDLLAAGVPEGPAVGIGLRAALTAKLDGLVSGREAELAEALRAVAASG